MEFKRIVILLTFVGVGELLCSLATIGFGFWALSSDYSRFKSSNGIHIWSGAEGLICGLFCLMTRMTKKKHQVLGYILSLAVVGYACKAISVEYSTYKMFSVFNTSLLSLTTLSLFIFAFGIYFTSKKYINCFREVCVESSLSVNLRETAMNRDTIVIYDYFNNNVMTRFYSFSNDLYKNPPPLDGAPPPYTAESNESAFTLHISRTQSNIIIYE